MNTAIPSDTMQFGRLDSLTSSRTISMSAGDLSIALKQEIKKILKEKRGHQLEAVKVGVDQLLERNLISTREAQDLKSICNLVFGAVRGRENIASAALKVRELYQQTLVDPQCSPTACAIASIASAALSNQDSNGEQSNVAPGGTSTSGVVITITPGNTETGAVIGAVIGGVIGGIVGGGIGAGIGAAAGAAIGLCNEAGV